MNLFLWAIKTSKKYPNWSKNLLSFCKILQGFGNFMFLKPFVLVKFQNLLFCHVQRESLHKYQNFKFALIPFIQDLVVLKIFQWNCFRRQFLSTIHPNFSKSIQIPCAIKSEWMKQKTFRTKQAFTVKKTLSLRFGMFEKKSSWWCIKLRFYCSPEPFKSITIQKQTSSQALLLIRTSQFSRKKVFLILSFRPGFSFRSPKSFFVCSIIMLAHLFAWQLERNFKSFFLLLMRAGQDGDPIPLQPTVMQGLALQKQLFRRDDSSSWTEKCSFRIVLYLHAFHPSRERAHTILTWLFNRTQKTHSSTLASSSSSHIHARVQNSKNVFSSFAFMLGECCQL